MDRTERNVNCKSKAPKQQFHREIGMKEPTSQPHRKQLTLAEFPLKEHETNVPEPLSIHTAPPCELIFLIMNQKL